jgi:hypothetical protein
VLPRFTPTRDPSCPANTYTNYDATGKAVGCSPCPSSAVYPVAHDVPGYTASRKPIQTFSSEPANTINTQCGLGVYRDNIRTITMPYKITGTGNVVDYVIDREFNLEPNGVRPVIIKGQFPSDFDPTEVYTDQTGSKRPKETYDEYANTFYAKADKTEEIYSKDFYDIFYTERPILMPRVS